MRAYDFPEERHPHGIGLAGRLELGPEAQRVLAARPRARRTRGEYGDIRPTKAVDRLLAIADHEKPDGSRIARPRQRHGRRRAALADVSRRR